MVVISDLTKGRKVGVESGYQGDFGVRNSGHRSFLQCCFSGDGFGSGNGLLDPSSAMTPSHQVIFQYLCMTGKIRIIRTNSSETKGLAESYPRLTMARPFWPFQWAWSALQVCAPYRYVCLLECKPGNVVQ